MIKRPIKFRAWDGEKLWPIAAIHWTRNEVMFHIGEPALGGPVKNLDEVTLMQFTGLHDKNGKEIWEGDILKAQDKTIWKVNFEYGSFGAQCVSTRFKGVSDWHSFATISFENLAVKIIGNIYENPELLQQPL